MTISNIPAGCWDLDLATGMLALCPQSRTMFGLSPERADQLTESEWSSRFHPEDLASVRESLTAGLVNQKPYAVRFRTIHPSGTIQVVLGVGRPFESDSENLHFGGWNFDVASTGQMAADWILAHPDVVSSEQPSSAPPSPEQQTEANEPPEALRERAEAFLRARRAHEQLLGRAVVGEPAFDLLLRLYVSPGQKETSLTCLAKPAGIPYSSAMRWIRYLADKGLVERTESISDRRVICVQLTRFGRAVMDELLVLR